jgi:hypothetical protein
MFKVIATGFALTLVVAPLASAQIVGPDGAGGPPSAPSALHAPDRAAPGAAERMARRTLSPGRPRSAGARLTQASPATRVAR